MPRKKILFILISLVLTSVWFGPEKIISHAEEGLPFYNLGRTLKIYSYPWLDSGLGSVNPFLISRVTFFGIASWFEGFKISGAKIQQLFFVLLILTPLFSVSSLTQILFPNHPKNLGIYASLFYLFNLFVLSQVFRRFIYSLIFLWSYLPLFLYLWVKWLEAKKVKHLFYFTISSLIFSDIFVLVSSVFAIWIPAGILWFKDRRIAHGLIGVFVWLLTSVWWWYPLVLLKDSPFSQALDTSKNLTSLSDVSKYFPRSEIIFLKQKYFFSSDLIWNKFFSSQLSNVISWTIVSLVVVGIITSFRLKNGKLLLLWFGLSWFLIKGANPPLGKEFYSWLFNAVPFSQVLRNPYEKLGVILVLPYSIFVAVGLSRIRFKIIQSLLVFTICFVLMRPLWTGQVFAGYQVEVPDFYRQANDYLNSSGSLRLLHLPFLHESGTSYTWGYSGDEPSDFLFDRPSVSKTYFFPNDPYPYIYKSIRLPKIARLLQFLAIDTIVLHTDTLPSQVYQENYQGSISIVDQMEHVFIDRSFKGLNIYRLDPSFPVNWGYLSSRTFSVPSISDGFSLVINNSSFKVNNDSFVISPQKPINYGSLLPNYTITKLSPTRYIYHVQHSTSPYILVLSQSYNSGWIARIQKDILPDHFQINGYANGWLVDKAGDYDIEVVFKTWPWE